MRRCKDYKIRLELTAYEMQLLRSAMVWFRNWAMSAGKPTEDINEIILRLYE